MAGCSPAEPTSVSPGGKAITFGRRGGKINQELPVRKPGRSVAKECPFFVQRTGSTSVHAEVFRFMVQIAVAKKLVQGMTVAVDSTTLEANAR